MLKEEKHGTGTAQYCLRNLSVKSMTLRQSAQITLPNDKQRSNHCRNLPTDKARGAQVRAAADARKAEGEAQKAAEKDRENMKNEI